MRILYADSDQVGQINFIAALKANSDWSAKYAFASPALANALAKETFDVIICSAEFIDDILPLNSNNTIVITLGDYEETGEIQNILDRGVDHYLKKPFSAEAFHRLANKINLESLDDEFEKDFAPDFNYLDRLTKGRTVLKIDLMNIYISVVSEEVARMKLAIVDKDYQVIAGAAHKMKSNVRMMGIQTLMQFLENIEDEAKKDNPSPEFFDTVSDSSILLEKSMIKVHEELLKHGVMPVEK